MTTTTGLEKLAARRRRTARLRRTVAGLAVSLFLAVFVAISAQMATGSDPVLSAPRTQVAAKTVVTTRAAGRTVPRRPAVRRRPTRAAAVARTSASATSAPVTSAPAAPTPPVAPVTTRQS